MEMPRNLAERLAKHLMDNADEDPLVVDVPNDGFSDAVARELEKLGHRVEVHDIKKGRLTIHCNQAPTNL